MTIYYNDKEKCSKYTKTKPPIGHTYYTSDGYVREYQPDNPNCYANGYVLQHRLVMEKHLGRYLEPEEIVHHEDGCPDNNSLLNLELFPNSVEHIKYHKEQRELEESLNEKL